MIFDFTLKVRIKMTKLLKKDKHQYVKNLLHNGKVSDILTGNDFRTITSWYVESTRLNAPTRIEIDGAKYGTKCLRFIFKDGTTKLVTRHIIVGHTSKTDKSIN